jgi:hypothetical protein
MRLSSLAYLPLVATVALATTGCCDLHAHGFSMMTTGTRTGFALAALQEDEYRRAQRPYESAYYNPPGPAGPPLPASTRDRLPPSDAAPAFDAARARAALIEVDLADCRAAGAPSGYGHAKVTFNPWGEASKVVLDEPPGLSAAAVSCIGDRLGAATVAPFRGSYVTVGTTYFVP